MNSCSEWRTCSRLPEASEVKRSCHVSRKSKKHFKSASTTVFYHEEAFRVFKYVHNPG